MKLMIDTDLGVAATSVYNYVEGGSNEISVCLPKFSDHSSHCIAEMFEETIEYLEVHLHGLYAMVDEAKGKKLRKRILEARHLLEVNLAQAVSCLPFDPEIVEYRDDLRGQIDILDELLELRKHDLKARLQLLMVEIIDDRPAFYAHFGVLGQRRAPVVILVDHSV
jgi:hypothetical protein